MVMRYIDEKLVYDSAWYGTCCPLGHALRETSYKPESPKVKPVYQMNQSREVITRTLCCPNCIELKLNHDGGHISLASAIKALYAHQVTQKLNQE